MAEELKISDGEPLFGKLAIIGIGLIGSSIVHAVASRGLARHTMLFDHAGEVRDAASALGLGNEIALKSNRVVGIRIDKMITLGIVVAEFKLLPVNVHKIHLLGRRESHTFAVLRDRAPQRGANHRDSKRSCRSIERN